MSESRRGDGTEQAPSQPQSGLQIWIMCALFVLVPALIILIVKYVFGV